MNRMASFLSGTARFITPLAIIGAGIGGLLLFGQRPEIPQREISDDTAVLIETVVAETYREPIVIDVEGVAVPYRQLTLSAEVAGRITEKDPGTRSGNYVTKDQFLFQIDETDYELEIERLRNQFKESETEIDAVDVDIANTNALIELANEDLRLRKKELARSENLSKKNAVSESAVDASRRLELSARNTLQTLENQRATSRQRRKTLEAARDLVAVQKKRAQIDRQRARITSPVNGMVISDRVRKDEYVKKGDPLIVFSDTSHMEVKFNLRVDELYWVWLQSGIFRPGANSSLKSRYEIPKTKVDVVFEFDGTEYIWEGELSRYEGSGLDEATRTVPCRVLVANPTQMRVERASRSTQTFTMPALITGMYVTIRIRVNSPVPLIKLPSSAVRPGGHVWVVRNDTLYIESINVVRANANMTLVRVQQNAGLTPGEKVVVSPLANVRHGMAVREALP